MQKRLFVAITIPDEVEKAISYEADALSAELPAELGARFISQHKLHFTIIFLDSQEEEGIPHMIKAIEEAVSDMEPFEVNIVRMDYAPEGDQKRMIWAYGNISPSMEDLKGRIEKSFENHGIWFPRSKVKFVPHITLARFEPTDVTMLPEIAGKLDMKFNVLSVELVESERPALANQRRGEPDGSEYHELASVDFGLKGR